jgi:X-Pro dipeptidyl-peptidase
MNRWFTRFLCGIDNGVDQGPRAWIVREGDPPSEPTPYPDYPHPDTAAVTLYLVAGGAAVGGLALDRVQPAAQQPEKLVDDVAIPGGKLAQAPASEHRLLYATPELREPVHVSGTPRLRIRLAANRPAANLSAWLVTLPWVDPDSGSEPGRRRGRGRRIEPVITRGWADPQNSQSLRDSAPLEPGRFYELSFALEPDDQIIPAGQRIGLMIFSSDRDFTLWPPPGTELTVDLDATTLELPVVGGEAAFARAVESKTK